MANLLCVSAQGALVRSRFLNVAQMDAPSQIFFGPQQRKKIHHLCTDGDLEIPDSSGIQRFAVEFSKNLFKSEWSDNPHVHSSFLSGLPLFDS